MPFWIQYILKRIYIILSAVLLAVIAQPVFAEEYGLVFSSYDVPVEKRTSLQIIFSQARTLNVAGSTIKIGFDVKIDNLKEHYGYVCRIPLSKEISLDLVLSNSRIIRRTDDIIAVLGEQVVSALPEDSRLSDWNRIEIEFQEINDTLSVCVNGSYLKLPRKNANFEIPAILFGRHNYGELNSNDVAPMLLRDLIIDSRGRKTMHCEYPLKDESGLVGAIANPIWLNEYNTRWHLLFDIPSDGKVFHALDRNNHCIYIISDNSIECCHLKTHLRDIRTFSQKLTLEPLTNDFGILPDGRLFYFDAETYTTATFDWSTSSWSKDIVKDTYSPYLGHSSFFNPQDSSVVHLFGYGYHRYSNEAHTWNIKTGKFRRFNISEIPPRYFSCLYQTDTSVFVIGGIGNKLGLQELGVEPLTDVYKIRLADYSVSKVNLPKQVFPESLVSYGNAVEHNGKYHFLAFPFPSENSGLKLMAYNPKSGVVEGPSDNVPFIMSQWAEFFLDYIEEDDTWYAVVSILGLDGNYHTQVYTSVNPLGFSEINTSCDEGKQLWMIAIPILMVLGAIFLVLFLSKRGKRKVIHIRGTHPGRPGIYLIGFFRVVDQTGKEIGSTFSPRMKELLSLLLVNYKEGVSVHELHSALWPDMEESNFSNNFRVNLKKIRDALKDVVNVDIYKESGIWKIDIAENDCDYLVAMSTIEELSSGYLPEMEIDRLVSRFKTGNLLDDISRDWLDKYKASYSSAVISMCYRLVDSFSSPEARLKIAEIILSLDSLEEEAAYIKCKALLQMKKINYAQDYFRTFTNEYQKIMGEFPGKSFKDFIK